MADKGTKSNFVTPRQDQGSERAVHYLDGGEKRVEEPADEPDTEPE